MRSTSSIFLTLCLLFNFVCSYKDLNAEFQRANAMMGMQQSYFQRLLLESGNDNLTEKERVKRLRIRRQIKIIRERKEKPRRNMVFKGDDLLKIKSQDMGKCSEACKGLTPCESWTYNHERSTCYLKGKDGPQKIRIQEGFTSGVIIKRKQMPDFNTSNCPDAEKVWVRHNELRLWHDAEPLEWDDALAAQAQAWADSCPNSHSPAALAGNYGENMGLGHHDCSYALEGFYAEAQYYTPGGDAAGNMGALHFTQVVWKDTKQLGCGWSYCNGDSRVVCQYMNGGNRIGHFDANVSR